MDGCAVTVNVEFTGEVTVQGLPSMLCMNSDVTWQDFEILVAKSYDCEKIVVKYYDEDNDIVTISTDEELKEAMKFAVKNGNSLVIRVTPVKENDESEKISEEQVEIDFSPSEKSQVNAMEQEETGERTCGNIITPITESNGDRSSSSEVYFQDIVMPKKKSRSYHSRMMRDCHLYPRTKSSHKTHTSHSPFNKTVLCDSESGEKAPDMEPKPPVWFVRYMEKFKEQLSQDVSSKVTRRAVRQILKGLEGAVVHTVAGNKRSVEDPTSTESISTEQPMYCHTGIVCDCCEQTIVGVRYKCGNCDDYDLCSQCESIDDVHDPEHIFLKIKRPALMVGRKKGRMVSILKKSLYAGDDDAEEDGEKEKLKEAKKLERMQKREAKRKVKKEEKLKRSWDGQKEKPRKKEKLEKPIQEKSLDLDAKFVRDETFPDGTQLPPGTRFLKKWLMRNTGNIAWDETVKLCVLWGTLPPVTPEVSVPALEPGEQGIITVELVVPEHSGMYQNHWRLQRNGFSFGHRIWCNITVCERESLEANQAHCLEIVKSNQEECNSNQENGESEPKPNKQDIALSPCKELLSFEMLDINDSPKVKVAKASQTATPNNTPLDLSPPKSPAPELDIQQLSSSSSVEVVSDSYKECDSATMSALVQERMASLGLRPDIDVMSISSCSDDDSDTENDFFIVPLPDCFNTSLPLARSVGATGSQTNSVSDSGSEKSIDDMLTASGHLPMIPLQPALVVETTDNKDTICEASVTSTDTDITVKTQLSTELQDDVMKPADQTECETGEQDQKMVVEHCANAEASEEKQCTPNIHIEIENVEDNEVTPPQGSEEPVADQETGQAELHQDNPEFANIMSTALGVASMAASQAFHTAKDVFNTLQGKKPGLTPSSNTWHPKQSQWTPSTNKWQPQTNKWVPAAETRWTPPTNSANPEEQLIEMGFCNRDLNRRLLDKYENDVEKTVGELLHLMDNNWQESRH